MTDQTMIPVFVPRSIGMQAVHSFAEQHDCKLICSKSGALVLEPRKPKQGGAEVMPFRTRALAPEMTL